MIQPTTLAEIQDICATKTQWLPVGARTKAALALPDGTDVTLIDMRAYSGIVSYDPSEFLISVRGGTSIHELIETLGQKGQYLPFDPVLSDGGATIGGSIASGISGPCRMLYGGLRDFMLEVALCDSQGREIRGGGKVVKNAAGFDLPKLVVGSYGRMGVITEATLKVFPSPQGWLTIKYDCPSLKAAVDTSLKLLAMPLPIAALEIEGTSTILVRLAGPVDSLDGMSARVIAHFPIQPKTSRIEPGKAELDMWRKRSQFSWASAYSLLIRVAIAHHQCADACLALSQVQGTLIRTISCGVSVLWIAAEHDAFEEIQKVLDEQKLSGVVIRGTDSLTLLGDQRWVATSHRIQKALDSAQKIPPYSESVANR